MPLFITKQIDDRLTHSTYVEFPASGHQQLAFFNTARRCARAIAADFLQDPAATLDTSCAAAMPAFDFTPPAKPSRVRPRTPGGGMPGCTTGRCLADRVTAYASS